MAYNSTWLVTIIQALLLVTLAPLFTGIIKWVKCQLQNRTSPVVWQPYLNLFKLFHKEAVIPTTSSSLFRFIPYAVFGITLTICTFIPSLIVDTTTNTIADIIAIIGLLALIRFLTALAGMDTGTAFGGMGSSREMFIAAIAEPAIVMVLFAIALLTGSTNLENIIGYLLTSNLYIHPSLILAAFGFLLVALAETGRIPIDNPSTHLELTMIHEAMILEYSGKYLALIEWSAQIKLMLYATLFINLFFPWGIANYLTLADICLSAFTFIGKMATLIIILGVTETSLAKLRLFRIPSILNIAFVLGLLAVLIHIIIEVK